MALTETLTLDISGAQRQIDSLNAQLDQLSQPIDVPVNVTGEGSLDAVTSDLAQSEGAVEGLNRELRETDDALRGAGTAAKRTGDDIDEAGRKGSAAFAGMGKAAAGLVVAFGAVQGARAFLNFANDAVQAASNLEESTSKATVVFGEFFNEIEAFSSTAPQALGLANAQALEFAGTFGNLFVALGLTQSAAAELAPQIVQLGADLASFNNLEVTEALDKLRAGLVGEAEPLRSLGVNLTAATTEAKALELGLVGVNGEVSEAAKVQARYALILEQTQTAQGDYARTADGLANTQRTLSAEFIEFQQEIGQALVPAFRDLLGAAEGTLPVLEGLIPVVGLLAEAAIGAVSAFEPLGQLIGALADPIADAVAAFDADVDTSALDQLSDSARDLFENTDDAIPLLSELQTLIATGLDSSQLRDLFIDLADALEGGTDPLDAATAALKDFSDAGTITEEVLTAILDTAGLTEGNVTALLRAIQDGSLGLNLTASELIVVETVLGRIANLDPQGFGVQFSEFINGVGASASAAVPEVEAFRLSAERLAGINQLLASSVGDDPFAALPELLGNAADAMRTEEGEIRTDFTDFLDDLRADVAAQREFDSNLDLLRAMGFENLAATFEEAGIEANDLLIDALTQPAEASEAERILDQQALLDALDTWTGTLESGFDALGIQFDIPVYPILQPLNTANFALPQGIAELIGVSGSGPGGTTGGTTIINNYNSPEIPPNDISRNNQVIRSIVRT